MSNKKLCFKFFSKYKSLYLFCRKKYSNYSVYVLTKDLVSTIAAYVTRRSMP